MRLVAEYLMEKETITNADVTRLIGPRPFSPGKDYLQYVEAGRGWEKEHQSATQAGESASTSEETSANGDPATFVGTEINSSSSSDEVATATTSTSTSATSASSSSESSASSASSADPSTISNPVDNNNSSTTTTTKV